MPQTDFMHARATEMLREASPLQHAPWIARLVRDVVDMCANERAPDPLPLDLAISLAAAAQKTAIRMEAAA